MIKERERRKRVREEEKESITNKVIRREEIIIPNLKSETWGQMHFSFIKTIKMLLKWKKKTKRFIL